MTPKQWLAAFEFLCSLYPGRPVADGTGDAYYAVLKDIDHDLVWLACKQLGSESQFFPAAAEIRERCLGTPQQAAERYMRESYSAPALENTKPDPERVKEYVRQIRESLRMSKAEEGK